MKQQIVTLSAEVVITVADDAPEDWISRADVLVLLTGAALGLTPDECGSGGRHVETGYALAKDKWVVVVGEAENIFHRVGGYGCLVEVVPNWLAAVGFLVEIQGEVL